MTLTEREITTINAELDLCWARNHQPIETVCEKHRDLYGNPSLKTFIGYDKNGKEKYSCFKCDFPE